MYLVEVVAAPKSLGRQHGAKAAPRRHGVAFAFAQNRVGRVTTARRAGRLEEEAGAGTRSTGFGAQRLSGRTDYAVGSGRDSMLTTSKSS